MQQPESGITVTTKFFPLAFMLFFCSPRVVIDGYDYGRLSWGQRDFPVPAGRHHVKVFCPYLFLSEMGANEMVVDVQPGTVAHVQWYAPFIVFMKGSITFQGIAALPGQPHTPQGVAPMAVPASPTIAAGWHTDPSGRHQHRYWDGTRWTDDVADGGAVTKDALTA